MSDRNDISDHGDEAKQTVTQGHVSLAPPRQPSTRARRSSFHTGDLHPQRNHQPSHKRALAAKRTPLTRYHLEHLHDDWHGTRKLENNHRSRGWAANFRPARKIEVYDSEFSVKYISVAKTLGNLLFSNTKPHLFMVDSSNIIDIFV